MPTLCDATSRVPNGRYVPGRRQFRRSAPGLDDPGGGSVTSTAPVQPAQSQLTETCRLNRRSLVWTADIKCRTEWCHHPQGHDRYGARPCPVGMSCELRTVQHPIAETASGSSIEADSVTAGDQCRDPVKTPSRLSASSTTESQAPHRSNVPAMTCLRRPGGTGRPRQRSSSGKRPSALPSILPFAAPRSNTSLKNALSFTSISMPKAATSAMTIRSALPSPAKNRKLPDPFG